ncbi:unnamed protein product [Symbiodinium natans]|uniref:Uncharacterized protein n=1 Tax=Symbiodinium natans TaxID=878477 RepID=A0A812RWD3_9DINO|nr:unnamed protein product [Symbiodinium natans]
MADAVDDQDDGDENVSDDDAPPPPPRSPERAVQVKTYTALSTDSDDSGSDKEKAKDPDRGVRKLLLDLSSRIMTDINMETSEAVDNDVNSKACLGTTEDRNFLASMVHRFARDDLKSDGDGVEAAIRMCVHTAAVSALGCCV